MIRITVLPSVSNIQRCRLTHLTSFSNSWVLPKAIHTLKLILSLTVCEDVRKRFQKDDGIDEAMLASKVKQNCNYQEYSSEEEEIISRIGSAFDANRIQYKELYSPEHFVKMASFFNERDGTCIARGSTIIDSCIENLIAFDAMKKSRAIEKRTFETGSDLLREVYTVNDHHQIFHNIVDIKFTSFAPREWVVRSIWKKIDDDTSIIVGEDVIDDRFPIKPSAVRASSTFMFK